MGCFMDINKSIIITNRSTINDQLNYIVEFKNENIIVYVVAYLNEFLKNFFHIQINKFQNELFHISENI